MTHGRYTLGASKSARLTFKVNIESAAHALGEPAHIAAELVLPPDGAVPRAVMVCSAGGGMNRRYYDLPTPEGVPEASFAVAMAERGFAVAILDNLGIGESTVPRNQYLLHPDLIAAATGEASRFIVDGLRAGSLSDDLAAYPALPSIGVGHSFGAFLTIVLQATRPVHNAFAILGYHLDGSPEYLPPPAKGLGNTELRQRLVEIARICYPEPYTTLNPSQSRQPVSTSTAAEPLLNTIPLVMISSGMIADEAATIDIPLFLAFGDNDIHKKPYTLPASFTNSPDITLIVLKDTRHNHFIYPSRTYLFDRISRWFGSL